MSNRLGALLVELDVKGSRLKRYIICVSRTLQLLWQWRRQVVFVQNPSLVLAVEAAMLRKVFGYKLIIDAHNAGIYPAEGKSNLLQRITDWALVRADLVLVTNQGLAAQVERIGGNAAILPDPLPKLPAILSSTAAFTPATVKALFVCTWAADEPYIEVLKAAEALPHVQFFFTGNSKGREAALGRKTPINVILTGYLPDEEYEKLLLNSDVIIDLTTREDCLVCGAYESVAADKPFVLSDTQALRHYFRMGGVFVDNNAAAIVDGLKSLLGDYQHYAEEIRNFRQIVEVEWDERRSSLLQFINAGTAKAFSKPAEQHGMD